MFTFSRQFLRENVASSYNCVRRRRTHTNRVFLGKSLSRVSWTSSKGIDRDAIRFSGSKIKKKTFYQRSNVLYQFLIITSYRFFRSFMLVLVFANLHLCLHSSITVESELLQYISQVSGLQQFPLMTDISDPHSYEHY